MVPILTVGDCGSPIARSMLRTILLLFCGVIISGAEEIPLYGVEVIDSNGTERAFKLLRSDLPAPHAAVSKFCRHARLSTKNAMIVCLFVRARMHSLARTLAPTSDLGIPMKKVIGNHVRTPLRPHMSDSRVLDLRKKVYMQHDMTLYAAA